MVRNVALLVGGLLVAMATTAHGHHPLAEYREGESRTLKGTLAELVLRNPHSVVYLDVQDAQSGAQRWTVEWVAALELKRHGVTAETLKLGDSLLITGWPAKDSNNRRLWLRTMTRPADGWRWTGGFD